MNPLRHRRPLLRTLLAAGLVALLGACTVVPAGDVGYRSGPVYVDSYIDVSHLSGHLDVLLLRQRPPSSRPMLLKADRIPEAGFLLQSLSDFPDTAKLENQQLLKIREETARQITSVLETRRDVGQHRIAANGARLHPRNGLTPDTVVRVETLVKDYETLTSRIERVRQALPMLAAKVGDESLRTAVQQIVREVAEEIEEDSIDRFAAFELQLSTPEADLPNDETQLATALSGWLLGAENTLTSFTLDELTSSPIRGAG